jgi:hypothetical protein
MQTNIEKLISKHLWLSATNPGASRGHKLVVFPFTRFQAVVPLCGNLSDDSWIVRKLKLEPMY